jgi:hypothetical protein
VLSNLYDEISRMRFFKPFVVFNISFMFILFLLLITIFDTKTMYVLSLENMGSSSIPDFVDKWVNNIHEQIQATQFKRSSNTIQATQSSQVSNGTQHQDTIQATQSSQVNSL